MKDSYRFYVDKLGSEYRKVFDQVEMYVGTQGIDENTREEHMGQLLDLFLTAQGAGKPVNKIAGSNIEEFCKAFCSEFDWKNRLYSILDGLKGLAVALLWLCALDIIGLLMQNQSIGVWQAFSTFPISGYLLGILCGFATGFVSNVVVRRYMFKSKRVSMRALKVITWGLTGISCIVMFALVLSDKNGRAYPIWLVSLCAAGYLAAYHIFCYKRLKEKNRGKVRFSDLVGEEMKNSTPEEMEKKYQRANKRSIRQGKGELGMEEFLEKEEKACNDSKKHGACYALFPLVITAVGVLFGEFDGLCDMVIYAGILLAVEYFIVLECWRIERLRCAQCRAWIKMKREQLSGGEGEC